MRAALQMTVRGSICRCRAPQCGWNFPLAGCNGFL